MKSNGLMNREDARSQRGMDRSVRLRAVQPANVGGQKSSPRGLHAFVLVTSEAWQ